MHTTTHTFDHVYPGSENNSQTVILYGLIGIESFLDAHKKMVDLSANGNVKYIFRHYAKVGMECTVTQQMAPRKFFYQATLRSVIKFL